MDQLIRKLMDQASLTEEQARQAVDVFVVVIDSRLPDVLSKPVIEAIKGSDAAVTQLKAVAEGALGKLGGMFGRS